jgi:hypothetical protein
MMRAQLLIICLLFNEVILAQFTDRYWAFGDSSAIDFKNVGSPLPSTSILRARGTCTSICDSVGDLILYAASANPVLLQTVNAFAQGYMINRFNQIISNGDSLKSGQLYQEMTIVPNPANSNQFYVFSVGVTSTPIPGIYYSLVDMSLNNGQGYVIQKNIQLRTNAVCDAIAVTRHGNGRDWWVVFKNWNTTTPVNDYYVYLVSPSGVSPPIIQNIGEPFVNGGLSRLKFNLDGNHLYCINFGSFIERFTFDRCTGVLSNTLTISNGVNNPTNRAFWSIECSADESKLYATAIYNGLGYNYSYLYQFDLTAPNILASIDTLATFIRDSTSTGVEAGFLKLGPDHKIYLSTNYQINDCGYFYLYCDTSSYFTENMNLSVINYPDSLGSACDFQPYSFYLAGHRTYHGLPNNANYELGRLVGSVCDTLSVGINEQINNQQTMYVYYDTQWQTSFINAKGLKGKKYSLTVYDITGKAILNQNGNLTNEYFTYNLPMEYLANGVYIVSLVTEKEKLTSKMVKN